MFVKFVVRIRIKKISIVDKKAIITIILPLRGRGLAGGAATLGMLGVVTGREATGGFLSLSPPSCQWTD